MNKIERREFLRLAVKAMGVFFLSPPEFIFFNESQSKSPPFKEILRSYSQINSKITAVNLSCIPNQFVGKDVDFHHHQESLVMAVPYKEIEKGKLNIYGYAPGLKEAVKRKQKVVLVVENPPTPEEYNLQSWTKWIEKIAEYFRDASTFIIGNEINDPNSSWSNSLDQYRELYLAAYQKIKSISPKSLVFPWQDAYYGEGEALKKFLSKDGIKEKVDGLAFNFYDTSEKIEKRVDLYRQILKEANLNQLPLIISELGKPGDNFNEGQQARLVIQNLATAAYLENKGKINLAAWYCAYCGPNSEHALSYSTNKEFVPKSGLFAFLLCQRLLVGKIDLIENQEGLVEVKVSNEDKYTAFFVWNRGKEVVSFNPALEGQCQIWNPEGERKRLFGPPFSLLPFCVFIFIFQKSDKILTIERG